MTKLFVFNKLDWPSWQTEYKRDIRVNVDWDNLIKESIEVDLIIRVFPKGYPFVYLPKYKGGNYKKDKPIELYISEPTVAFLRCPAVRCAGRYLILDGYHRATGIKPKYLIMDTLILTPRQSKFFADTKMNPFWKKWIKGG